MDNRVGEALLDQFRALGLVPWIVPWSAPKEQPHPWAGLVSPHPLTEPCLPLCLLCGHLHGGQMVWWHQQRDGSGAEFPWGHGPCPVPSRQERPSGQQRVSGGWPSPKWVTQHCLKVEGQALIKDKSSYLQPCRHKPPRQ